MEFRIAALRRLTGALLGVLLRRGKFAVFFFSLFTVFLTGLHLTFFLSLIEPTAAPESDGPMRATPPAISEQAAAREAVRKVEGRIRKGTGLASNLRLAGLPSSQVEEILSHLSAELDFRRLHAGDRFALFFDPEGRLKGVTYQTGPLEEIVLTATAGGWEVGRRVIPAETRVVSITGKIESSLFESLERLGEGDRLTLDFVDIFAWDIDFSNELRKGDTFRIVVEKIYRDGKFLTYGKTLAAQYRDSEEVHQAFYFKLPSGRVDYYTPGGKSVRKTFLRAPVSYTRISSGYSKRRLHPILKRVGPHLGVDYAAPEGTAVWAAADGVVVSKSYDRRNGRKLVLRHPNAYTTYYLHLSRFAKGMKIGSKVKQKQVIGYVGSSGMATGPHLDYRMKRHGRWRNPLKEKFPPGKSLPEERLEAFSRYRDWLSGRLATPPDTFLAGDLDSEN